MVLCACGITLYYGLSDGRRPLANRCTAPGARICKLSQAVAGGAARSAAHSHCKQRSEAIHTCWQSTRIHLFLAQANMTETAPHFRFSFQHCRAGVRTLSGAGMGLSENPELIATHNALCVSSWGGHMPPVGSSYSQQSSHRRVSGRSCSRACFSTSRRVFLSASSASWRAWLSQRAWAAESKSFRHAQMAALTASSAHPEHSSSSVSYTHLTLPTNREV